MNFGSGEKTNLKIFLNNKRNNEKFSLEYWDHKKSLLKTVEMKAEPFTLGVRLLYPSFETIEYEILGGLILSNLSVNLMIENIHKFIPYLEVGERIDGKVVISDLLTNSYVGRLNVFNIFEIITKINDTPVASVQEVKKCLEKNKNKFIKIETENKKVAIISTHDVLENDKNLTEQFGIKLSKYHKLIK